MNVVSWAQSLLTPSGVWSLVTMAVSVTGLLLATVEPRWGWWWGIGAQAVWLVAGFYTHRPGDVVLSVAFTVVYIRGLRRNRGASYRDQAAVARENAQLKAELAELRSRCPVEV